jgi:hypothetical protein
VREWERDSGLLPYSLLGDNIRRPVLHQVPACLNQSLLQQQRGEAGAGDSNLR